MMENEDEHLSFCTQFHSYIRKYIILFEGMLPCKELHKHSEMHI